ncbi:hypothetical protein [Dactylosporangium sp. CA-092794]|uniref:hypothetical protein n=1 Tax=Dactylosporangium sp. CA-092794 TaxID=3239929 RepID=UPI003D931C5E
MTGLDRMVSDTLTRIADDDVHVERLLAGARAGGLRLRRRRRLAIVAGAALSVAAVGTGIALAAALLPAAPGGVPAAPPVTSGPAPVSAGPAPSATARTLPPPLESLPALPVAAGEPTALSDPSAVGRPLRIHLGLDALPFPVDLVQYLSSTDGERLNVQGRASAGSGTMPEMTVRLARSTTDFEPLEGTRKSVTVGGRPGTFAYLAKYGAGTLRWRLANGLWLQVSGPFDEPAALAVGNGVRLDRTFRCAVPLRLPSAPAAAKPETCTITFIAGEDVITGLTVAIGGSYISFTTEHGNGPPAADLNETLGGRPARVVEHPGDGGNQILEVLMAVGGGAEVSVTAEGHYDGAVVRGLTAGLQWLGGADPSSWPENPLPGS